MAERSTPEASRRVDTPARPVRLADGCEWGFSRPTVRLVPTVVTHRDPLGRPIDRVEVGIGFGYPLEVQNLVQTLRTARNEGTVSQQYEAFFSLAVCLLRRAHDLDLVAACELLSVTKDELPRLVQEIMAVVSETEIEPQANSREVAP
ncbi:MAG: hypothetical protein NVSMB9_01370 [Isosphaeraceae bacterium]